jgi:intracellular sulfur oxidation DsrE/DsrF family protein
VLGCCSTSCRPNERKTHVHLSKLAHYAAARNIATGNPYRDLVFGLMNCGVKVELCGAIAKANGWGNADLLPAVKINTDAMARTIQLVQQGLVKITE